ncbi:cell envelope integrity protein CreD [Marinigracilibium pacificum]|uniref:Cell envelope integrity protein CreD n=1 Tax=Marinigracilibium pacificum TaxID=2729599 RepID=A0A848J6T4_9BACT|nr:cell envelope integrity protein CreD [Marinigracilibium pacificum]NMM50099.1 cell envelope integrity protein CreD [Marinigracilibium pacificum]
MEPENNERHEVKSIFDRLVTSIRNSVMLKMLVVGILILLLLIPSQMIISLIEERRNLNDFVTDEVSEKWAEGQTIAGPVLTIPVISKKIKKRTENNEIEYSYTTSYLHVLPQTLNINGEVVPKKLSRGIYEAVVYEGDIKIDGDFTFDSKEIISSNDSIDYKNAFLTIGISDLRGVEERIVINWNGNKAKVKPGSKVRDLIESGITATVNANEIEGKTIPFSLNVKLKGSSNLSFVPAGGETNVNMKSTWPSPKFDGAIIPDKRNVTDAGFTAFWQTLEINRNYPQMWYGDEYDHAFNSSAFGLSLLNPADQYQNTLRAAKYSVLTITLTFLVFFLAEALKGQRIHPFQYILVGFALCLFYALLVALSEHMDFNVAYLISSVSIIGMIFFYSLKVFHSKKYALMLLGLLTALYSFLYVTLKLEDYALLMGTIGLAVILALTMYLTRNINWYKLSTETA